MKKGTQIVSVPTHAKRDITHPDCRRGFIASDVQMGRAVYVHFWAADAVGVTLRSEQPVLTDVSRLVAVDSVEQGIVDGLVG